MRALSWMTCLWPGLATLWVRGRWTGLAMAVVFAGVLNFALLATFGEVLPATGLPNWVAPVGAWVLALGFWVLGIRGGRKLARPPQVSLAAGHIDDWFRDAQTQYLKGHWIEAETLLSKLLAQHPDDVEAALLMASIQRRTRRLAESKKTLIELTIHESAARWTWEIHTELARITASEELQRESEYGPPPQARAA